MSKTPKNKTIKVDYMARVEGEGALYVKLKGNEVEEVRLEIFEPPRFFEGLLRGRNWTEAPDITSRICGICPIAYQASAINAMEAIAGIEVPEDIDRLRRMIYCGEWIESHVLHIAMLHAPDFLGYPDAMKMAEDHPEIVRDALRLKKAGNSLLALLGGREIHPINMRIGGFYRAPSVDEVRALIPELEWAVDAAEELVSWTADLEFPVYTHEYEFVAMRHEREYPMWHGRIVSNEGIDIPVSEFFDHFTETQVEHSTALHSFTKTRGSYMVGPMARYNLNFDRLRPRAAEAARNADLGDTCRNPFQSIVVRSVEVLNACDEALSLAQSYEPPARPHVPAEPRAGVGVGSSEAPRGICVHRYEIDEKGVIQEAKITPPTSQNQRCIEEDLARIVPLYAHLPKDELTWKCEQSVRNYDPCISCSTHFLKLELDRA